MFATCKHIILMFSLFFGMNGSGWADQLDADLLLKDGMLTLSAQGTPLGTILQDLASQTGISFEMKTNTERFITVKFNKLPLVEGLRKILNPDSFVIEYGKGAEPGKEEIHKIIVYGNKNNPGSKIAALPNRRLPGGGKTTERAGLRRLPQPTPVPEPDPEQTLESYGALLRDPDPELREEAISDMVDDYGVASLPYLEKALIGDGNDDVRVAAAGLIGGMEEQRGIAVLAKGLDDLDEDVRLAVVEALGEIGGLATLPVLEKASNDSNEEVRDAAKYLIEELKE